MVRDFGSRQDRSPMNDSELDRRLAFAVAAAERAGQLALRYASDPAQLGIVAKGLQDVVTIADRAVEEALRREFAVAFPGDAVLGEEDGLSPGWRLLYNDELQRWALHPPHGAARLLFDTGLEELMGRVFQLHPAAEPSAPVSEGHETSSKSETPPRRRL